MALTAPERVWWRPVGRQERVWVGLSVGFTLLLFFSMPAWHLFAKQNTPNEYYRIAPAQFLERANAFIDQYQVGTEAGLPVVRPPEGDVYLIARQWQWSPILVLTAGKTYRLHLSSVDVQHSLSLQPTNMNFQVVPGYDYVLTITPTPGSYTIICNQFCGLGHYQMSGKIVVE